MIKVMIVEDAPQIAKSLKSLIESLNSEFEIISCAYDGEEALKALDELKPKKLDVIFTDIRMPNMNGLTLLQQVKLLYPDTINVIISGFQDFEYAKQALQLGVTDYLLKPVSPKEVTRLLSNISYKINQRNSQNLRNYFSSLIKNDMNNHNQPMPEFTHFQYALIIICAGAFPIFAMDYLVPGRNFWAITDLTDRVSQLLNPGENVWFFDGKSSAEKIILLGLGKDASIRSYKITEELFQKLLHPSYPITLVLRNLIDKANDIGLISQLLRINLNHKIIIGHSQIIYQSENGLMTFENIGLTTPMIDQSVENKLVLAAGQANIKIFQSELYKLMQQWNELKFTQLFVEKLVNHIVNLCQKALGQIEDIEMQVNEAISISCSYQQLFQNILCIFENAFSVKIKSDLENDSSITLMKSVDQYICNHYTEPITNQSLAKKFGHDPVYLSKIFKKYKGMSPSEYIIHLRIEKAKELITSTPCFLTKDVSAIVGYTDPLYFSRIFKKITGMYPSKYKV